MKAQRQTTDRPRTPGGRGVCPLCEKAFLQARLHAHIAKERPAARHAVVEVIKEKFPLWTTEDGACKPCWESFRDVARVVRFLKRFRFPKTLPAVVALAWLLAGCGKPAPQPPGRIAVQTTRAESMETFRPETEPAYIAIVRADNETDLSFKVGGIVDLIGPEPGRDWDEGTRIQTGTVLARLKQADFVNTLNSAQARADLTKKVRDRFQALLARDAISKQEMDVTEADWLTAQAHLEQARQNTNDSQLRASIDGTVLARYVNSGVTVGAGQPVLRFADTRTMSVELGVPDRLVNFFSPGKELAVDISALAGHKSFPGHVTEVGVAASQDSRLYRVVIKVRNTEGLIRSGMTATVRVGDPARFAPGSVRVPLSALVTFSAAGQTGETDAPRLAVFIVTGGKAQRRPVKTGDIFDSSILVNEGLKAGDEIVTAGASFLYDGAPVEVVLNVPVTN